MVTPMAISQHAASRGDTGTRSAGCRSAPCAWCADNVALLAALAPLLAAAAPSARREKLVPPPTAAAAAAKAGHPVHVNPTQATTAIYNHALAVGFSRGFEVSAGIALLALIITIATIRGKRGELAGIEGPTVG